MKKILKVFYLLLDISKCFKFIEQLRFKKLTIFKLAQKQIKNITIYDVLFTVLKTVLITVLKSDK